MSIYVVFSNYFDTGVFGVYSTMKRARLAFEHFVAEDEDITAFNDEGGYTYTFTNALGQTFTAEIAWDILDYEFDSGIIKEGE